MADDFKTLQDLQTDRASVSSHVVGFLKACQSAARLHQFLANDAPGSSPELISSALAHLQVFTVRALETFFRDCFVTLCNRDPDFLQKSAEGTKGKIDFALVQKFLSNSGSFEEKLAAQRSFQNLDSVNEAFSPFLGKPLFEALDERKWSVFVCNHTEKPFSFTLSDVHNYWRKRLYELFESRHQIIHNAHRPLPTDQAEVNNQFQIALVTGQLVGMLIGDHLQVGTLTVEVPAKQVLTWALAAEASTKNLPIGNLSEALNALHEHKDLDGEHGYIGPLVFFGDELMHTTFSDPPQNQNFVAAGRTVIHCVRPHPPNGFLLETLISPEETQNHTQPVSASPTPSQ